jgi:diguanylate cyclase (GGDEF)-like protein
VANQPSVIDHFVGVVPSAIWLTLALAVSVAGAAGAVALTMGRRARRQAGELAAVAAAAHTDSLTEVLNRRGFTDAVERELARARRYDRPFVLAYLDIRGLKTLNDTEGHPAGDGLLKEVAQLLRESARGADVVGRIGGDEFALLLTEQPAQSADAVTQRIRERVAAKRSAMRLTVPWDLTIGTAAYPHDGQTFDELVARADRRLYEQRGIELSAGARAS